MRRRPRVERVVAVDRETIRRHLAANQLKQWQMKMWGIPKVDAKFVAWTEEVLDLYAEPPDEKRPVVCFDETPRQLIGEARVPVCAKPGKPARFDYEYVRNGTASVFMSTSTDRGATRRSPTGAPAATSPSACASSSTSTTRDRSESAQ